MAQRIKENVSVNLEQKKDQIGIVIDGEGSEVVAGLNQNDSSDWSDDSVNEKEALVGHQEISKERESTVTALGDSEVSRVPR